MTPALLESGRTRPTLLPLFAKLPRQLPFIAAPSRETPMLGCAGRPRIDAGQAVDQAAAASQLACLARTR